MIIRASCIIMVSSGLSDAPIMADSLPVEGMNEAGGIVSPLLLCVFDVVFICIVICFVQLIGFLWKTSQVSQPRASNSAAIMNRRITLGLVSFLGMMPKTFNPFSMFFLVYIF